MRFLHRPEWWLPGMRNVSMILVGSSPRPPRKERGKKGAAKPEVIMDEIRSDSFTQRLGFSEGKGVSLGEGVELVKLLLKYLTFLKSPLDGYRSLLT